MIEQQPTEGAEQAALTGGWPDGPTNIRGVTTTAVLIHDRPAAGLLGIAHTSQLVVVGNRGHGGITGMVSGSTSQTLVKHSPWARQLRRHAARVHDPSNIWVSGAGRIRQQPIRPSPSNTQPFSATTASKTTASKLLRDPELRRAKPRGSAR
ncbi:MAG: universal stress protein [Nakamurella sp.]